MHGLRHDYAFDAEERDSVCGRIASMHWNMLETVKCTHIYGPPIIYAVIHQNPPLLFASCFLKASAGNKIRTMIDHVLGEGVVAPDHTKEALLQLFRRRSRHSITKS